MMLDFASLPQILDFHRFPDIGECGPHAALLVTKVAKEQWSNLEQ